MFSKGSRYQNLPESSPVDAGGERLRGKDIRRIPRTKGTFLHTVREGDRLDLLAFNYYGDATKWWRISDANADAPFPTDLLQSQAVVVERITLTNAASADRFYDLIGELARLAANLNPSCRSLPFEGLKEYNANELAALPATLAVLYSEPSFLRSTIVVIYPASGATREVILRQIKGHGFHLLSAQSWHAGSNIGEVFNLDDPGVRQKWRETVEDLSGRRGVLGVKTNMLEGAIEVRYNCTLIARADILQAATSRGFQPQASMFARVGTKIVIPPDGFG